jgi:hypothetical protein
MRVHFRELTIHYESILPTGVKSLLWHFPQSPCEICHILLTMRLISIGSTLNFSPSPSEAPVPEEVGGEFPLLAKEGDKGTSARAGGLRLRPVGQASLPVSPGPNDL